MSFAATAPTNNRLAEQRRAQIGTLVGELEVLPSSTVVPMRVMRLQRSESAGMAEIAEAISADAGLVTKILSLVNSAAFAPAHRITRLSQAVSMIGMQNLMPLLFGLSLGGLFSKLALRKEDRTLLFHGSLLKACTARRVAEVTAPELAEEAFVCGLLQDVAIPVVCAADRAAVGEVLAALELQDPAQRRAREEQIYGCDHAGVGRNVALRLRLPELFVHAIGSHHAGCDALAAHLDAGLSHAVDVAAAIPHRFTPLAPQKPLQQVALKLRAITGGADPAAAGNLVADVLAAYTGLARLLGESDESGTQYKQFLHEITSQIALSVEAAVGASQAAISNLRGSQAGLAREVDQLRQEVVRSELDALTGVPNRGGFVRRISVLLSAARTRNIPCMFGYADIDNFKSVNDTHGHATGDRAICAVAARLAKMLEGRGVVGRLGGDEFAFVVVCRPGVSLDQEGQALAAQLSRFPVDGLAGEPVHVTASTGLLSLGVPGPGDTIESVMARADKLMYEVKRSGKGRCVLAGGTTALVAA